METILAFILGFFSSYYTLGVLCLIALYVENKEGHEFAAFLTLVASVSAYLIFSFSLYIFIPSYFVTGFIWSIWRWRIHCRTSVEKAKAGTLSIRCRRESSKAGNTAETRIALESAVSLKGNANKVIAWVLGWPISVIDRALHDLIHVIRVAITEYFSKLYTSFSNKALKDFDNDV